MTTSTTPNAVANELGFPHPTLTESSILLNQAPKPSVSSNAKSTPMRVLFLLRKEAGIMAISVPSCQPPNTKPSLSLP